MIEDIAKLMGVGVLILAGVFAVVAGVAGLVALSGLIVWALWNALVPAIFDGPSITYVQGVLVSVALSVLGSVLGRR